ncbi:MAG TPA: presqualene diphosphate synthase HpnD [Terriglobia bacterium]|nr:presqualene diphosphate synthase HpnD [Terriglobia bacterium]
MSVSSRTAHFTNARTTNFYYAFAFLPPEKRLAIEAVYAFARRGDDIVDGGLEPAEAAAALARYREALEACYAGDATHLDAPELRALAEAIRRFRIPRQPFEDLILGLGMDLNHTRYQTFEDLSQYCYRVASTIGLMCIEIFGYKSGATRDYAVNLGKALQLVNILRDIQRDAQRGRIYIPGEDLDRFEIRPGALLSGTYNDSFIELMQFQCDRARYYFDLARRMLTPEDRRSMTSAEIMAAIYWDILRRIQRRRYNVFGKRVRVPRPMKLWIALAVYLGVEWYR